MPLIYPSLGGLSQPVTISIRKGGGQCVDPPQESYGRIIWERRISTGTGSDGEFNTFIATLQTSPGMRVPVAITAEVCGWNASESYGPSCPIPGYRSLDAGTVRLSAPGSEEIEAVSALVDGKEVYRADLPKGAIKPGLFQVRTTGDEVGAFDSNVEIGSPINITSAFPPGTFINRTKDFIVNWTGGDPDSLVTVKLMNVVQRRVSIQYSFCRARASAGRVVIPSDGIGLGIAPVAQVELLVEVTPDPSKETTLSAPGLTLGGKHTWKYKYRFGGLRMQ